MEVDKLESFNIKDIEELQPEGWTDILPSIDFYIKSDFCFPLKISKNNKIIAIGTTIIHGKTAWIAHVIVHKDFRKLGLGYQITENLIKSLTENIETTYLIATELGLPIYEKLGFVKESEYWFYKDLVFDKPFNISKNIVNFNENHLYDCFIIDQLTSNEQREKHIISHLEKAKVYQFNNSILGFYLPNFGEGLIIAKDPKGGIELLKLHLNSNSKLVFPAENENAKNFIKSFGFEPYRKSWRMRLGNERALKLDYVYSRINGSLG